MTTVHGRDNCDHHGVHRLRVWPDHLVLETTETHILTPTAQVAWSGEDAAVVAVGRVIEIDLM